MSEKSADTTCKQLMLFAEDFPVKTSVEQAQERVCTGKDLDFGSSSHASFARLDLATLSWRTYQCCAQGDSELYSKTWPRSGTMQSGTAYRHRSSTRLTRGTGSLLWPTPTTSPGRPCEGNVRMLRKQVLAGNLLAEDAAAMLDGKDPFSAQGNYPAHSKLKCDKVTPGKTNPAWIEWLMGFPIGWTDIDASEMR